MENRDDVKTLTIEDLKNIKGAEAPSFTPEVEVEDTHGNKGKASSN